MTQAQQRFASFEDYLSWDQGEDGGDRYELINGELVALPPESEPNNAIAQEIFIALAMAGFVPRRLIKLYACEIQVAVLQRGDAANRYPDLTVLGEEHLPLTRKRLTITLAMLPPRLVVEVVSPSPTNWQRDYLRKRAQYAARGIPEYWLINPQAKSVMVLCLQDQDYAEIGLFQGESRIISPTFPALTLTAADIFNAVN